jgi:hypothetical protein
MNERIKELAEQAGFITTPNTDVIKNKHFGGYIDGRQFEKFAELIVKECMNLVDRGGEFVSRPKLVERIKEHFGVEE